MKITKRILVTMLALVLAIGLSAAICAAQQPTATKGSTPAKPEAKDRLIIKGKIGLMGSAQYYVQAEEPLKEYLIVNPNAKQLQSLMKKGKTVRVEGYTTVSADRLFGVYEYLPASIRTFPDQERLATSLREAGFRQVEYRNLTGGIVAIHVATK